jgi:prophage maintenance system killer protein
VTTLDVADLVVIAGHTLGIGSDAALGQVDVAAALAALALLEDQVVTDQDTAAAAGVALIYGLLRHRPFAQQGEQVAVAAGLQFLSLNGWRADLDPPAAAAVVVEALASGQLSPVSAAAWLSPRLSRSPVPAARGFRRPTASTRGRRALASVGLAAAVGGFALLATACSRAPVNPAGHATDAVYTTCMRSHGISTTAAGTIVIGPGSSQLRSAELACQKKALSRPEKAII